MDRMQTRSSRSICFGDGTHPLARPRYSSLGKCSFCDALLIEQVLGKRRQVLHFRSQTSRPYSSYHRWGGATQAKEAWATFSWPFGPHVVADGNAGHAGKGETAYRAWRLAFGIWRSRRSLTTSYFSLLTAHNPITLPWQTVQRSLC
jgi:hypothetical protein